MYCTQTSNSRKLHNALCSHSVNISAILHKQLNGLPVFGEPGARGEHRVAVRIDGVRVKAVLQQNLQTGRVELDRVGGDYPMAVLTRSIDVQASVNEVLQVSATAC